MKNFMTTTASRDKTEERYERIRKNKRHHWRIMEHFRKLYGEEEEEDDREKNNEGNNHRGKYQKKN